MKFAIPILACFILQISFSQDVILKNKKGEPITSPEKGIPLSNVEEVILRPTVTGTAYGVTSKVVVYLLLKNGTIYSRPSASPHDLDVLNSKKIQPKKWGKWSKKGNQLIVNFKSVQTWKKFYKTSKYNTNERFNGIFKTVGAFSDSKFHTFNTIIFKSNGTFTCRYFYKNKGNYKPHSKDKKIQGSYKIKDYTIELTYNSGDIERFLIAKHMKGNGLIMGSKSFYPFTHSLLK